MVTASKLKMVDISRQKPMEATLDGTGGLTPSHTVGQAIEHYLQLKEVKHNDLRWGAFSRGVKLDNKRTLSELPEKDAAWTVMPEVSAGRE